MTTSEDVRTVLVTGATGKVGRHLVTALLGEGVRVRALVRHPLTAGLPGGVETVAGDLTDAGSVAAAARGADAAFLLWMGFDPAGAQETVAALAARVSRIVYLSAAELQGDAAGVKQGPWSAVEAAIEASGAAWTFLRAGGFAGNALEWAPGIRTGRPVALPYPGAVRSPVHERDIADAAVRCLLDPGHDGRAYEITGPEQLTLRAQAELVGEAIGRPVTVEHQPRAAAEAELAAVFGEYAASALDYWATLEGSPERVAHDVEQVTGHPARTFASWARDHAEDFRALGTAEVARRYADGFRTGDVGAALALLAPDVVRVAPLENDGTPVEVRGLAAIVANAAARNDGVAIDGVEVSEPMVGADTFTVRFTFHDRIVHTGERRDTTKISLCTVHAGRIVREEVFYHTLPSAAASPATR